MREGKPRERRRAEKRIGDERKGRRGSKQGSTLVKDDRWGQKVEEVNEI